MPINKDIEFKNRKRILKTLLKLGCQVSITGKIYDAIDRAVVLGCNVLQIFIRNPRQHRRTELSYEDIKIFKEKIKKENISSVIVHIPYTLNLASSKEGFYRITIKEFIYDLLEADKIGADYLITHMGSYKGTTEKRGLLKIVRALDKILQKTNGIKTNILLENTSGSGNWLGYKFCHQEFILKSLNWHKNIGLCLDTAHAWAAGYKIDELEAINKLLDEIDKSIGLERLKVIHLNDTKESLNSKRDRHADIGDGNIGKRGFYFILTHPKLRDLIFILETPKKNQEDDLRNLTITRRLYYDKLFKGD